MSVSSTTANRPSLYDLIIKRGWLGKGLLIVVGLLALWKIVVSLLANPTLFLQQDING